LTAGCCGGCAVLLRATSSTVCTSFDIIITPVPPYFVQSPTTAATRSRFG
jgi:hypothetical protein